MGLDQSLYATSKDPKDIGELQPEEELVGWRKNYGIHEWMFDRFRQVLNGMPTRLTADDLDGLEAYLRLLGDDRGEWDAIRRARLALGRGLNVFYCAIW